MCMHTCVHASLKKQSCLFAHSGISSVVVMVRGITNQNNPTNFHSAFTGRDLSQVLSRLPSVYFHFRINHQSSVACAQESRAVEFQPPEFKQFCRGNQFFFVVGPSLWNAVTFYCVLMVMIIIVVIIISSSSVISIGVGITVNALMNMKCSSCELVESCLRRCWHSSV